MNTTPPQPLLTKSLLTFLLITFAATWALEFTLISSGMRFDSLAGQSVPGLWFLAIMWVPGLAAIVTTRFVDGVSFKELRDSLGLRLGTSIGPYFLTFLLVPILFMVMYGLTSALGLAEFDPEMQGLIDQSNGELTRSTILEVVLPLSIVLGPLINFIFGLGEEIGWRGFLLPKLMVLGKAKAYLILGITWGVWHAPLIYAGLNYPGHLYDGIVMMCILSISFGYFLNEMTQHYRSTILAGFIHGAVNAQGYGIWIWLFPETNPILGGSMGLIGATVWLAASLGTTTLLAKLQTD